MTDLFVRRSDEVRDRDDDDRFICHLLRPDFSGDSWTTHYLGEIFEAQTRGLLLNRIEYHMTSKGGRLAIKDAEHAAKENQERHRRSRGAKKVKGKK